MRKDIIKIAKVKFEELSKKYDGFINVIVDDWRGFRFVFDTVDVRECKNDCQNCSLFKLLRNERPGLFSAGLYPASEIDKKLFGPQNYLNCKTLRQYQTCYMNYLAQCTLEKEIKQELALVKSMKLIYSTVNTKRIEEVFKQTILSKYIDYL
jgi:hypothetical protein